MRTATLPHGTLHAGERRRDALVRPPTGAEELLLVESLGGASVAERSSALLAACVTRLGGDPVGPAQVRALVAGDREALLLHLRAAAFGEKLPCGLDCPACGEALDLELTVGELLVDGYEAPAPDYALAVDGGAPLRFRLPTGADLEAAAAADDA